MSLLWSKLSSAPALISFTVKAEVLTSPSLLSLLWLHLCHHPLAQCCLATWASILALNTQDHLSPTSGPLYSGSFWNIRLWFSALNFLYPSASFTLLTTHPFMKLFLFLHFMMPCPHFLLSLCSRLFPLRCLYELHFFCAPLKCWHFTGFHASPLLSFLLSLEWAHEYTISLNPLLNL